jgi:DNA-binding protein H-NS
MASLQELLRQQQMLAQQIEDARRNEIAEILTKIRAQVLQYDLTVKDVFPGGGRRRNAAALSKVAPKYRDPSTGKTWTGRGKAPKWIEGQDRARFQI